MRYATRCPTPDLLMTGVLVVTAAAIALAHSMPAPSSAAADAVSLDARCARSAMTP